MNETHSHRLNIDPDQFGTMTPEEAVAELNRLIQSEDGDVERVHVGADEILLALLRFHGHDDVIAAWHALPKWFS